MSLRIWLHEGHDGEPGVEAWALDILGFATWAASESEVLAQIPRKLSEHAAWLHRHGHRSPPIRDRLEVVEHVSGNEILFGPDHASATPAEIDETLLLLRHSRSDLLDALEAAPEAALDWDPPYRRFAAWASWRTVRATLAHIANGETHYYLRNIGFRSPSPPATQDNDWRVFLRRSRQEAFGFLGGLRSSGDLARVSTADHGFGDEDWSVRKALRRMIRHELLHWKSIRRILREHERRGQGAAGPSVDAC